MKQIADTGLTITVPDRWFSVGDNGPYGITPADSNAYMQICIAFSTGAKTNGEAMLEMVLNMAKGYEIDEPEDIVVEQQPLPLGAASFRKDGEFCSMWEIRHDTNIVSIIFTCQESESDRYLADCEGIVRSIEIGAVPITGKQKRRNSVARAFDAALHRLATRLKQRN